MHVMKEAQTSSRIEGTQTGIAEALLPEEQVGPEKRDDWREVQNYVRALNTAIADLERLPLSNRLLRQTHEILMRDVRGEGKQPGEFRTGQNWIGGSSLADAAFIPPHPADVPELMGDLENFLHNETITVPRLVRVAIAHYQFETIHPFNDGNGRIGRLLITLYLVSNGLLSKPSLYLSEYFERNRAAYYDALTRVRHSNDLIHWIRFFLNGVAETAAKGRDTFQKILGLRTEVDRKLLELGKRAHNAQRALQFFFRHPILSPAQLEAELGVSQPTVGALLKDFERLDIVREMTGNARYRLYSFEPYISLFLK